MYVGMDKADISENLHCSLTNYVMVVCKNWCNDGLFILEFYINVLEKISDCVYTDKNTTLNHNQFQLSPDEQTYFLYIVFEHKL